MNADLRTLADLEDKPKLRGFALIRENQRYEVSENQRSIATLSNVTRAMLLILDMLSSPFMLNSTLLGLKKIGSSSGYASPISKHPSPGVGIAAAGAKTTAFAAKLNPLH
ncbi:MAG: hypothetical protein WAV47_18560, partial [Blastocatellia bacterium]